LKKVALAVGNSLVYADTYEQALTNLAALQAGQAPPSGASANAPPNTSVSPSTNAAAASGVSSSDPRVAEIRAHLNRYRELSAQGKWAEAGKELEAIEAIVKK